MICKEFEKCISAGAIHEDERCSLCRSESADKNVSCNEKGKRYNLRNDKGCRVINYLIDGGVYVNENELNKCDRMYYVDDRERPTVLYIELKGKNIEHALEQLYDTASRHKFTFCGHRKCFRIVCSGAPKIANNKKSLELKKKILREFESMPLIKERVMDESYSRI